MPSRYQELIKKAYSSFNARDIDAVFTTMQPDVLWSNGWEGGYVTGYDEVREYWTRQWKELDPNVDPVQITDMENGKTEVKVHQLVKDVKGNVLFDGWVKHIYSFEDGLIKRMDIEKM